MVDLVAQSYEPFLVKARARLDNDDGLRILRSQTIDPSLLALFLIYFSSRGVKMTAPVADWIRRAGERCIALGFEDVGQALVKHARHEAGHDQMMIDDTHFLVKAWNERIESKLDADALLSQPATQATIAYIKLHEDTIEGPMPYGQVAIEFEIERMSTVIGPWLIKQCKDVLGPEIHGGLSFIAEHTEIDVGHTELNRKILNRLLTARPEDAEKFAAIGSQALETYLDFLDECITAAIKENLWVF